MKDIKTICTILLIIILVILFLYLCFNPPKRFAFDMDPNISKDKISQYMFNSTSNGLLELGNLNNIYSSYINHNSDLDEVRECLDLQADKVQLIEREKIQEIIDKITPKNGYIYVPNSAGIETHTDTKNVSDVMTYLQCINATDTANMAGFNLNNRNDQYNLFYYINPPSNTTNSTCSYNTGKLKCSNTTPTSIRGYKKFKFLDDKGSAYNLRF